MFSNVCPFCKSILICSKNSMFNIFYHKDCKFHYSLSFTSNIIYINGKENNYIITERFKIDNLIIINDFLNKLSEVSILHKDYTEYIMSLPIYIDPLNKKSLDKVKAYALIS